MSKSFMTADKSGHAEKMGGYAEVVPLSRGDLRLTYRIPPSIEGVEPGVLVLVPLQRQREKALVLRVLDVSDYPDAKIRNLSSVLSEGPVMPADLREIARWMATYYLAPLSTVVETMLPAPVRQGTRAKVETRLRVAGPMDEAALAKLESRAPRQAQLMRFLLQQPEPVSRTLVLRRMKLSASVTEGLVEKGLLCVDFERKDRESYADGLDAEEAASSEPFQMNEEQAAAVEVLEAARQKGEYACWLLHGVTGSGKTEVYLRLMESVLREGGQILFLVPEIALAPQTVARVRSRLLSIGAKVVVWHSNLSAGERADAFRSVAAGEANVVVGARSAVFAPFEKLNLVIVDEEHEPAFKQEEAPRYHGRDVAIMRAYRVGALCVLGSATPSLETLYNAKNGKYRTCQLTRRVDDRQLPLLHVVDLRRARGRGEKGGGIFSPLLREKMRDRMDKGEQIILFLNRRGYSTVAICPSCGHVEGCPHCSIPLTLHRTDQRLRCHLCGYEKDMPVRCPSCGSPDFRSKGAGTQKVEVAVQKLLPKARVVRLDADSFRRRHHFREVFQDFRRGKIDVLVGTQMIAKGLDFPNVTLVGLVDADLSLHQEDFRAAERTFQLIVQVSGRSGRGDRAGEVVVQTLTPHAGPIQYARRRDFDGFLLEELALRQEYRYPPYRHLIRQLFSGKNEEKVWFVAEQWTKVVETRLGENVEIRGPAPAPIEKMADEYRVQLWYFTGGPSATGRILTDIRDTFVLPPGVRMSIDVDAVALR